MTGYALVDAFRHHAWATDRLLEFCAGLDDETLHAREVSTERDIREIFHHLIGSESYYRRLFAGSFLDWGWSDDVVPPMPQMRAWAVDLGAFWEKLLAGEVDGERILVDEHPDGSGREVRAGVVLAQVLDHGSMHREQICAILTSLAVEPPHMSVWRYALEHGRDTVWTAPGTG